MLYACAVSGAPCARPRSLLTPPGDCFQVLNAELKRLLGIRSTLDTGLPMQVA